MNRIKKRKYTYSFTAFLLAVIFLCLMSVTAFANVGGAIGNSTIAQGTIALMKDVTSWMLFILPTGVGLCCLYFALRMAAVAEENEKIRWKNLIKTALTCLVFGLCVTTIVKVAMIYYGGTSV